MSAPSIDPSKLPFPDININDPAHYIPNPALVSALEVAIALGQPLLVTGEPGSGKTQLAHWVARSFNLGDPQTYPLASALIFNAKTSAAAKDLLYSYDAVRHFHDAGTKSLGQGNEEAYISLRALGEAIVRSLDAGERGGFAHVEALKAHPQGHSSVVLIDEIDKAPRDFPNDLLHEIDRFEFDVPELRHSLNRFKRHPQRRIITIITSNSEKNLPEPFLRRCAFFNIEAPSRELLREIVHKRLGGKANGFGASEGEFLYRFYETIRAKLNKKPATAELLNWLKALEIFHLLEPIQNQAEFSRLDAAQKAQFLSSLSVLVKTPEDMKTATEILGT
jgi:MoxR-like ATPase